jgi:hypothetical protein
LILGNNILVASIAKNILTQSSTQYEENARIPLQVVHPLGCRPPFGPGQWLFALSQLRLLTLIRWLSLQPGSAETSTFVPVVASVDKIILE